MWGMEGRFRSFPKQLVKCRLVGELWLRKNLEKADRGF
jgi:hypothetical protein